jgi:hypothetical protein
MATRAKKNPHDGSTLDDWLREEGILEEVKAEADRRIKRWQLIGIAWITNVTR